MVANAIGHLAEAAWHHPELEISYGRVKVALNTHEAKGITEQKISSWRARYRESRDLAVQHHKHQMLRPI